MVVAWVHVRYLKRAGPHVVAAVHRRREVRELGRDRRVCAVVEGSAGTAEGVSSSLLVGRTVLAGIVGPGEVQTGGVAAAAARHRAYTNEPRNESSNDGNGDDTDEN